MGLVAVVHLAVRNLILPRTTGTASRQPLGIPTGAAVIMMEKLKRVASQLKCISKLLGTLMERKRVDVGSNHHSGEGFQDVMTQYGAVFYSSQWTGWVPGSCGGDGNLGASS